jgi:hypothetical protein
MEFATETSTEQLAMEDAFTPEQLARLRALRAAYHENPTLAELGLDLRRLEFARWLVARGMLNEGL